MMHAELYVRYFYIHSAHEWCLQCGVNYTLCHVQTGACFRGIAKATKSKSGLLSCTMA